MNLHYEVRICQKIYNRVTMTVYVKGVVWFNVNKMLFPIFFVVFLDTINLPCTVIDGEFWFWSSDWETFLSVMSLPAKDEKCSVSNALWQIWCRKQKNELCTAWTYDKVIDEKRSNSTHSKPFTMARTRLLKCFVLQHSIIKTKNSRSLIRCRVQGFEWVEILELRPEF